MKILVKSLNRNTYTNICLSRGGKAHLDVLKENLRELLYW